MLFLLWLNDALNFYHQILTEVQRTALATDENNAFYQMLQKVDYYDNPVVVFGRLKPEFR